LVEPSFHSTNISTDNKRSEKLQHALYKIASIHNSQVDLSDFYQQIHHIIADLIHANNFFIALYNEDEQSISFPYLVDEQDDSFKNKTVALGTGLTSHIINTRKAHLLDKESFEILMSTEKVKNILGSCDFSSWMGAPMISTNVLHGVIVIQSYDERIIFNEEDLKLLSFVANHVANAIEITLNMIQRQESQVKLANQHRLLLQKNEDLNQLVDKLQSAQKELIQKEKMASLGGLVAGIAHEINTPLGICVTGVSHLAEEYKLVTKAIAEESLTQDQLMNFFDDMGEILTILTTNTQRGAELVNSFKQVAVDQSSNELRNINVKQYIDEIILSLKPTLKRLKVDIKIICQSNFTIEVNAGAVSQILSNLIFNSVRHGFVETGQGKILIECYQKKQSVVMKYADDGLGMDEDALKQLFDPFYTTKRGEGGSGLGSHLVYNLVTSSLKGKLTVQSKPDKGLAYLIKFPLSQ